MRISFTDHFSMCLFSVSLITIYMIICIIYIYIACISLILIFKFFHDLRRKMLTRGSFVKKIAPTVMRHHVSLIWLPAGCIIQRHHTMCSRTRVLINNTWVQRHHDGASQLMRKAFKAMIKRLSSYFRMFNYPFTNGHAIYQRLSNVCNDSVKLS